MDTNQKIKDYVDHYKIRLDLIQKMWGDPRVQCYNDAEHPSEEELKDGSVFLAGPTSRKFNLNFNWRCQAVEYLRHHGYRGWIYVPEPRGMEQSGDFTERSYIHNWESSRLISAAHKVFWIPRSGQEMLGLNTNLELGIILGMVLAEKPLSVFVGWPSDAERMGLPDHYVLDLAKLHPYPFLAELCEAVAYA